MIKGRIASFDLFRCMNMSNILNLIREYIDMRVYVLDLIRRTYIHTTYDFDHAIISNTMHDHTIILDTTRCDYDIGASAVFDMKDIYELQVAIDNTYVIISVLAKLKLVRFTFRHNDVNDGVAIRRYHHLIENSPQQLKSTINVKHGTFRFLQSGVWICTGVEK